MSVASQQPLAHTMMRCTTSMFHCFFISQTAIVTVLVRNFCHGTSGHYWSGFAKKKKKKHMGRSKPERERERTDTGSRDREQRAERQRQIKRIIKRKRGRERMREREGEMFACSFLKGGNKVLHLHGSGLDRCTTCEALLKACVH